MKKILSLALFIALAFTTVSNAATLSAIYDFSDLDASTTSFEGLAFTDDGSLWITSAPNDAENSMLAVDLALEEVVSISENPGLNPVALASDGTNLYIGNNMKAGSFFGMIIDNPDLVLVGQVDPSSGAGTFSEAFTLAGSNFFSGTSGVCEEPEGSAYMDGYVYFSCQDGKNVVKIDPSTGVLVESIDFGVNLLGLGATEDSLIVGDYTNHALLLYDVSQGLVTETIDLSDLFVGDDSDYTALTGEAYNVTIADNGDVRHIPDPDGIAYRDGKIYMTFEHDLRVFEISLDDPPVATPEPGTLFLIGIGILGLAGLKKKRS